jgi:hypothetical protein
MRLEDGGIYIFSGDFRVQGGARLYTDGDDEVLIFLTCDVNPCNGQPAAHFEVTGNSNSSVELKGLSGDYQNIAIYVDRTSGTEYPTPTVNVAGQGAVDMAEANIYNVGAHTRMAGNGGSRDVQTLVTYTLEFDGNAEYRVHWDLELETEFEISLVE